jgi:hypothetical protein
MPGIEEWFRVASGMEHLKYWILGGMKSWSSVVAAVGLLEWIWEREPREIKRRRLGAEGETLG